MVGEVFVDVVGDTGTGERAILGLANTNSISANTNLYIFALLLQWNLRGGLVVVLAAVVVVVVEVDVDVDAVVVSSVVGGRGGIVVVMPAKFSTERSGKEMGVGTEQTKEK